jgi:phytoene dehydrogenase-like protein
MRKCDVVILGANAGGILAGALLTKKGFSVLMLEEKARAGPVRGQYRFRRFSNLSDLLVSRPVVERIYHLLGLPLDDGEFSQRKDLTCQILIPGHRVDIPPDRTEFLDEMKREFPGDFGLIERLCSRLQGEDWIRRTAMAIGDEEPFLDRTQKWLVRGFHTLSDKRLSSFLSSTEGDKAFGRFIDVQIKSTSYLHADDLPVSLASHLMAILVEDETFTDMSGSQGLMDRVKRELGRGGGRIRTLDSFSTIRIETSPGEFRIYTKEEGHPILSRVVIGDIPFTQLKKLIPAAFSGRKWDEKGNRLWPKYFVLSLNLGIEGRGVPIGLGNCFVSLRDADLPYENGNLLMVYMGPEGIGAPPGRRSVTVNTFVPFANGRSRGNQIKGVIEKMMTHLSEVAPFLDRWIRVMDEGPSLGRYGSQWNCRDIIYETTSSFRVGKEILPIVMSMEGLFLACRENFPYLGFEGEILSGIKTAEAVFKRFG